MRTRLWQILWIALFGAAFGFIESSVVVYLRTIYYPGGFTFPLRVMGTNHLIVEILREVASILVLAMAGTLAGKLPWERVCYPPTPAPSARGPAKAGGTRVAEKPLDTSGLRRTTIHEVAPMESIWRIAKMYDVSEQTIYEANHLQPGEPIRIGQKLTIPNAKGLRNIVPLYPSNQWKYLVIHHTATEIGKATIIHNSHHDRGFWQGLGYHFLIDNGTLGKGDGQIEVSPRWIKQQWGAHCQADGMNTRGIGIALVGNFNYERPTPAQIEALTYLVTLLRQYYQIPLSHVIGHRDIGSAKTDCPGRNCPWRSFTQQLLQ